MGVVGFVGVGEHAVGHGCFDGPAQDVRRRYGRDFFSLVRAREMRCRAGRERGWSQRASPQTCPGCDAWSFRSPRPAGHGSARRPCRRVSVAMTESARLRA